MSDTTIQSKMFDPAKPFHDREGKKVTLTSTDMPGTCPLAGYVTDHISMSEPVNLLLWDRRGKFFGLDKEHNLDLVNVPETHECWINLYQADDTWISGSVFTSRDQADMEVFAFRYRRVSCIHHEWEE